MPIASPRVSIILLNWNQFDVTAACLRTLASLSGPTYETPAEYRMVRKLGADVVGMSTIPEVIAAQHAGIRVLGLSVVSNVATDDDLEGTSGDDVLATVAGVAPAVGRVVTSVLASELSS